VRQAAATAASASISTPVRSTVRTVAVTSTPPGRGVTSTSTPDSAQQFNLNVSDAPPPTPGQPNAVPASFKALWAWDAVLKNWYFYSPLLEQQAGGIANVTNYCTANGYLDFTATGKTLQQGVGFWVQLR